jgi:diguanylate cyclase (GGDEF)-like protein
MGKKTKAVLEAEVALLRRKVDDLEKVKQVYEWIEGELSKADSYDSLTGLPSWNLFFNLLSQSVALAQRNDRSLAVLFYSLDRLYLINDNLGEHSGDLLLTKVAARISESLRKSDILSRPGKNQFLILLPEIARAEDAVVIAERIFTSVSRPIPLNGSDIVVTGNIGMSIFPDDWTSVKLLIRRAYAAMVLARAKGRNIYRFYSSVLNERAFSRLRIENSLRVALERQEFCIHYQPQVDVVRGRIVGFEALLRWCHPEFGDVSPAEFIPIMEEIGLIAPLSEWVLRMACAQNIAYRKAGFPAMTTAVNLSPRQLYQSDLPDTVGAVLRETGLEPHCLELELTEGAMVRNIPSTTATLTALREMGVKIAIDDFGIGYSSLSYLRNFPITRLKIDKSFVDALGTDRNNRAICGAIITLAHSLGLGVIAEGVETAAQLEMVRALGCNEVQGYLISRPVAADELLRLLEEKGARGGEWCLPLPCQESLRGQPRGGA